MSRWCSTAIPQPDSDPAGDFHHRPPWFAVKGKNSPPELTAFATVISTPPSPNASGQYAFTPSVGSTAYWIGPAHHGLSPSLTEPFRTNTKPFGTTKSGLTRLRAANPWVPTRTRCPFFRLGKSLGN